MKDPLISAVVELNEEEVIKLIKQELKSNNDPLTILERVRTGVEKVGQLYSEGKYFIADLIMSGLIFEEILKYIEFPREFPSIFNGINVIFATVEEDIHDVGKNVTISLYKSVGINVIDLGVNVPAAQIVAEVIKTSSPILCLSGLLTSSYNSMKKTIDLLHEKQLRSGVKVIIGGNVNENIRVYAGADYWVSNCANGLEICEKIAREIHENGLSN